MKAGNPFDAHFLRLSSGSLKGDGRAITTVDQVHQNSIETVQTQSPRVSVQIPDKTPGSLKFLASNTGLPPGPKLKFLNCGPGYAPRRCLLQLTFRAALIRRTLSDYLDFRSLVVGYATNIPIVDPPLSLTVDIFCHVWFLLRRSLLQLLQHMKTYVLRLGQFLTALRGVSLSLPGVVSLLNLRTIGHQTVCNKYVHED